MHCEYIMLKCKTNARLLSLQSRFRIHSLLINGREAIKRFIKIIENVLKAHFYHFCLFFLSSPSFLSSNRIKYK